MTSRVKRILLRRSPTLTMLRRLPSIRSPQAPRGGAITRSGLGSRRSGLTTTPFWTGATLAVGEGVPLGRRAPVPEGLGDDGDGSADRLDGVGGRAGEGVRRDLDGAGQLAAAEHLDEALVVDDAGLLQALRRDL